MYLSDLLMALEYACECGARDRDTRYPRDITPTMPCQCGADMALVAVDGKHADSSALGGVA